MKIKIFTFSLLLVIIVSCQSREEKANKIISEELFKSLMDFDSYQVIETKIDSAFGSPHIDSVVRERATKALIHENLAEESLAEARRLQSTVEIWTGSYSSYGKRKFDDAFEEFDKSLKLAQLHLDSATNIYSQIREASRLVDSNFIGWEVIHKFRAKTSGGNYTIANYLYVFDPKMKSIIYREDTDDEYVIEIKRVINDALSSNGRDVQSTDSAL